MNNDRKYFAEKLKQRRKEKGLTQKELGEAMGLSDSIITMYEKGLREPRLELLFKLADILNVSVNYFFDNDFIPVKTTTDVISMPIQILGTGSCGTGINNEHYAPTEYFDIPISWLNGDRNNYFTCNASGDSMTGSGILDGDLILAKANQNLQNNQIGIFHVNGEEFIKKYKVIGGSILLQSTNPAYDDIEITEDDDFRIIARVEKVITTLN